MTKASAHEFSKSRDYLLQPWSPCRARAEKVEQSLKQEPLSFRPTWKAVSSL